MAETAFREEGKMRLQSDYVRTEFPAMGEPWTQERDDELRKLARHGYSRREIGLRVGRTTDAIRKRGDDLGLRFVRDQYGSGRVDNEPLKFEARADQVERDRAFIRALAQAIYRGDHLPGAGA